MVDGQQVIAGLLDAARDAIAMLGSHRIERLEDHERERALPDLGILTHIGCQNEYLRFLMGKQYGRGPRHRLEAGLLESLACWDSAGISFNCTCSLLFSRMVIASPRLSTGFTRS